MELPLLREIVIILSLSIFVILLCHRFKIPTIVGFLITGVLSGPHGLGFVKSADDVDVLATLGIVLLLFTVGMEFSFKKIFEYKRFFAIGGFLQVFLSIAFGCAIGLLIGQSFNQSLLIGFLLSLSSTAIVLRLFNENSESDSPHGRLSTGILIFQDIVAIPMLLLTPFLGNTRIAVNSEFFIQAIIGILLLVFVLFAATKIVPTLLYQIAKTRSRELFLLSVITICLATAWLTSNMGLSLSLGAFLAGLIISESEYRHEAISDILPFQDVFTSFFFISIGMLLDVQVLLSQPVMIAFITLGVIVLKALAASVASIGVGVPLRTVILTALSLSQIGEFSFVIAKTGSEYGLISDYGYQLFLAVSLLTMGFTPTLINHSHKLAQLALRLPFPNAIKSGFKPQKDVKKNKLTDHLVIIGFGLNGRNLAFSAKQTKIPYIILETNPETVKVEKRKGEPIHFGDATHSIILKHADIEKAKIAAVVINDLNAARRIVEVLRQMNPAIHIIVRTRYLNAIDQFYKAGADDVITDELSASIEIFTKVLSRYETAESEIAAILQQIKSAPTS